MRFKSFCKPKHREKIYSIDLNSDKCTCNFIFQRKKAPSGLYIAIRISQRSLRGYEKMMPSCDSIGRSGERISFIVCYTCPTAFAHMIRMSRLKLSKAEGNRRFIG